MADPSAERAILVGVYFRRSRFDPDVSSRAAAGESLEELLALARSAGAEIVAARLQQRPAPDAATLVGKGKVREIAADVAAERAELVIFDHDLTPTQQRNLEAGLGCRVVDRTQLILDIFARRARSREGRLQVELAQLTYLLPRLAGRGAEMSRLGGGIGTRGPGETQLETDRRKIARRLRKIREQLEAVRRTRSVQRRRRQGVPLATVAMVGYTNAGKSTLFNRLTGAAVAADARLFATLDPTARLLVLPSRRRVILSDTVGFIRRLPASLVQAFRATLEEVTEASLLLHVVDVSAANAEENARHVRQVLREIGAAGIPQLLVLNKIDRSTIELAPETLWRRIVSEPPAPAAAGASADGGPPAVAVSALTGQGIPELRAALDRHLALDPVRHTVYRFPPGAGEALHQLYEHGRILHRRYDHGHCIVEAEVPESLRRRLRPFETS